MGRMAVEIQLARDHVGGDHLAGIRAVPAEKGRPAQPGKGLLDAPVKHILVEDRGRQDSLQEFRRSSGSLFALYGFEPFLSTIYELTSNRLVV